MEWVRVIAADKGADLQWLVDTGGDHDAGGVARAIGRRLGAATSGTPVWAQHPDTGAYGHTVAVRVPAGRAAEMRAMAAAAQTLHIQGTECRFYPMTATRPASTRIEQGPRQVDAVHEAAMACNPGGGGRHAVRLRGPANTAQRWRRDERQGEQDGGTKAWRGRGVETRPGGGRTVHVQPHGSWDRKIHMESPEGRRRGASKWGDRGHGKGRCEWHGKGPGWGVNDRNGPRSGGRRANEMGWAGPSGRGDRCGRGGWGRIRVDGAGEM